MAMNFPLIGAMAPTLDQLPPAKRRDWRASLFDRLSPDSELEDKDKQALMRQGLLGLASGLLGTGGGFGNGVSAGIQSGLLAMNDGQERMDDRKYKQQYAKGMGMPSEFRSADMIAQAAGYAPGSDEYKKLMRIKAGEVGRASGAGYNFDTIDWGGTPVQTRRNGATGAQDVWDGRQWIPLESMAPPNTAPQGVAADGMQFTFDDPQAMPPQVVQDIARREQAAGSRPWTANTPNPYGDAMPRSIGVGRRKEDEVAAVTAAQQGAELSFLPQRNALEAQGAGMTTAAQEAAKLDAYIQATQPTVERESAVTGARKQAETNAEFLSNLPKTIQAADETMALLDKALSHPGRATTTGMSGALDPRNYARGTDARDYQVLADQLSGRAFLQAFESLKGAGQITEVEGRKATQAMARLDSAQSDAEYESALRELYGIAELAKTRATERASRIGGQQGTPQENRRVKYNPATGRIE